jgi:hypothetical protein
MHVERRAKDASFNSLQFFRLPGVVVMVLYLYSVLATSDHMSYTVYCMHTIVHVLAAGRYACFVVMHGLQIRTSRQGFDDVHWRTGKKDKLENGQT